VPSIDSIDATSRIQPVKYQAAHGAPFCMFTMQNAHTCKSGVTVSVEKHITLQQAETLDNSETHSGCKIVEGWNRL
jgi:hypothetical protein